MQRSQLLNTATSVHANEVKVCLPPWNAFILLRESSSQAKL